nr:protein of unknown function [Ralstonia solanacearum]
MGSNADRYNRQLHPDEEALIHAKANGDKAAEKRLTDAACYRVQCWAGYSPNSPEFLARYVSDLDAKDLVPELKWVDSQKVLDGKFEYTPVQKAKDLGLSQWDQFKRGVNQFFEREVPNLPRGFVNKMASDAKQKMSESPAELIAQGAANGLSAVVGIGGGEPPAASPGSVLVNSAARQAANASLGVTADRPSNVIASSGNDDASGGNQASNSSGGTQGASGGGKQGAGLSTTPSPALPDSPYSQPNVDARVKPPYQTNPAHDTGSPLYNPRKTPEPADAETAYKDGAVRGGMGTWYAKGKEGYYQYFYDNVGTVHFSGTIPESKVPNGVQKLLGK